MLPDSSHSQPKMFADGVDVVPLLGFSDDLEKKKNDFFNSLTQDNEVLKKHKEYVLSKANNNIEDNLGVLTQLADIHFNSRNFYRALKIYEKILYRDRNNILAYRKAILSAFALQQFLEVDKIYRLLLEVTNRRADILHDYAIFCLFAFTFSEGSVEDVLSDIEEVLEKDPKNFQALNTYGLILLRYKNQPEKAQQYFQQSSKISPSYVHSINNQGIYELEHGKVGLAIDLFKKAIEIDENYSTGYENLATSYIKSNDRVMALNVLQDAINKGLELGNTQYHQYGLLLLQNKYYSEAIKWYEHLLENEPQNDLLLNNIGVCYKKLKDTSTAIKYFLKAKKMFVKRGRGDERSLNCFYNLGRIAIYNEDLIEAEKIADELLSINSKNVFGTYLKGHIALKRREEDNADYFLSAAYSSNTTPKMFPEIYIDYSFYLSCLKKNYQEAVEVCEKALSEGVRDKYLTNNLAYAYANLGKYEKSTKLLAELVTNNIPTALATMGLIKYRQKDNKAGDKYFLEAVEIFKKRNDPLQHMATQIWLYEQALLAFKNKKIAKSKEILEQAKQLGQTYVCKDIESLDQMLTH